jgi:peptidoglycan hydrolase-like protein with peptidoglycan-binding domain
MTVWWIRSAFAAFFALAAAFAVNVFLLQPAPLSLSLPASPPSWLAPIQTSAIPTQKVEMPTITTPSKEISARIPDAIITLKSSAGPDPEVIRAIQRELANRGYEAGVADGLSGLVTRAAIMAYEADHGMTLTAEPSEALLQQILLGSAQPTKKGAPYAQSGTEAERVIRTVQQSLANLGYGVKTVDGRMGESTARAIREFEAQQGLKQTGRISGQLVARLARLASQGRMADVR